ncbi:hypothetical protein IAT38_007445 [Cryptococcus sp. DSM 104549]
MEALSRREEQEIQETAKKQALKACDNFVKGFADCATGRTFSLPFKCRGELNAMQGCMRDFASVERMDALKLEYIAHRSEKGREAVETLKKYRVDQLHKMAGIKERDRQV